MPPLRSFAATVRHLPIALGRTQASIVIPVLRSSEAVSGTVTQSFTPSNVSAPPFLPAAHVAPEIVPVLARPELSARVVPVPASNE